MAPYSPHKWTSDAIGGDVNVIALNACITCCPWATALGLLSGAQRLRLRVDAMSYYAALAACETEQKWTEALNLLRRMRRGAVWLGL